MKITGRPIVKKNNRTNTGRGFTVPSKRYRQWESDALWQLTQYGQRWTGKIAVTLTFQMKGRLDADLDNLVTSVLDVLQESGAIDDDKNVVSLHATKHSGFEEWVTIIEVEGAE